jgi:galactokinase
VAGTARALIEAFETRFERTPDVFRAPGRVNLIGEHTDYNQGYVLPVAIDLACYAASAPNRDEVLRVHSINFDETRAWPLAGIAALKPQGHWSDYVIGVARQLPLSRGRDVMLHSDVPIGAGLSSSASIEVASALALGWEGELPSLELAKLCRRAENDFVGLPSGIMDQYCSVFGRPNAAVLIDCRSLEHSLVGLPPDALFVAVNSMVKHELGASAYRDRVAECARAVEAIGSLRDASEEQLPAIRDPVVRKRARHVITENKRVLECISAAKSADLTRLGRVFLASHASLRDDYEVSCEELDFLVETAAAVPGVFGARMTGGGFGGCTVNVMQPEVLQQFTDTVRGAYRRRFGFDPAFYPVVPSNGAARIT